MPQLLEQATLKVHTLPDGAIWLAAGDQAPTRFSGQPADLVASPLLQRTEAVRLLGTRENAALIAGLYAASVQGKAQRIELGTPRALREVPADPVAIITAMRQRLEQLPASLGGWHAMTVLDYATYRLAMQPAATHPVLQRLQFSGQLDPEAVARLLLEIRDPRWHLSQQSPHRGGALNVFLGLYPEKVCAALAGKAGAKETRCRLVLACWRTNASWQRKAVDCDPGYFLWRDYLEYCGRDRPSWFAPLRTSQRFLAMLRGIWLDLLKGEHVHDAFFSPELFFRQAREAETFRAYCQNLPVLTGPQHLV